MKYEYKTLVRLKILSTTLSPEQITYELGVACEQSWKIGDNRASSIIKETTNGWVLGSGFSQSTPLEEQLEPFLNRLTTYSAKIRRLSVHNIVELSCIVYAVAPPALYFNKNVISSIAKLGANFDIDLYILAK